MTSNRSIDWGQGRVEGFEFVCTRTPNAQAEADDELAGVLAEVTDSESEREAEVFGLLERGPVRASSEDSKTRGLSWSSAAADFASARKLTHDGVPQISAGEKPPDNLEGKGDARLVQGLAPSEKEEPLQVLDSRLQDSKPPPRASSDVSAEFYGELGNPQPKVELLSEPKGFKDETWVGPSQLGSGEVKGNMLERSRCTAHAQPSPKAAASKQGTQSQMTTSQTSTSKDGRRSAQALAKQAPPVSPTSIRTSAKKDSETGVNGKTATHALSKTEAPVMSTLLESSSGLSLSPSHRRASKGMLLSSRSLRLGSQEQDTSLVQKLKRAAQKYFGKNSQVRSLLVTVFSVLIFLASAYVASFVITLQTFDRGSYGSAELNNAGKRRYLARETLNSARELMIGDPAVGTVPKLAARLRDYLSLYRRVHEGLRYGDEELHLPGSYKRYPAREALMYGVQGEESPSTQPEASADGFDALRVQGLHDQLQQFWLLADSLLQQYGDPAVPRVGLNSTALFANTAYAQLYELEGTFLGKGLESAVKLYRVEGSETIVQLEGLNSIFFGVNLTTMFGLYVLLHWLAVAQVDRQLQQREDVLMLLPKKMLHQTKRLRRYLKSRFKNKS